MFKIFINKASYFIISLIILSGSLWAQAYLTLDEALAIGLKQNTGIVVARGNAEIASIQSGLGTAGYMPALNISGSAAKSNSKVDTNSPFSFGTQDRTSYNGQLALSWTLFDGLFMFYNDEKFGQLSELGQTQLRKTIEDQSKTIISSYYDVVLKAELLKIAKEGETISKYRLEQEKVRKDLGSASSTDYLSAQVTYNNDRLNVLRSKNQLQISSRNLNILLGQDPGKLFQVDSLIPVSALEFKEEELISQGMKNNSTLLIQSYQKEISNIDSKSSYSTFYPRLSLNGSYAQANSETDSETRGLITQDQTDKQVGLNLSWNLFNGFRDQISVETAAINERNQEVLLAENKRQVAAQIRNQAETYRNSIEAFDIQKENVKVSEMNLKLFEERYKLGSASFVEYRVALLDYLQSKNNYIESAFLAISAETELRRLAGILVSGDSVVIK